MSGDVIGSPLATFFGRPPELTRYRTPVDGLYLSGAGPYPGAGIVGIAGRNAANTVLGDLSGGPEWSASISGFDQ